ncbi:MAG TPA: PAS domain S-box protein [Planctomycetota bacterium]|nr:PAS domain S-box protein [Planctomycetota bacterium]
MEPQNDLYLYKLLVQSATEYAIFATDLNGNIVSWNEGAQRILGYSEAEVLGRNCAIFFLEEDVDAAVPRREIETALRNGQATNERWHRKKGGEVFWASGFATSMQDDTGKAVGVAKVMRDRTAEKRSTDALEQSERRFRALSECSPVGIFQINEAQRCTYVNPRCAAICCFAVGHTVMEAWRTSVIAEDLGRVIKEWERCVMNRTFFNQEFRLDSQERWVQVRASPLFTDRNDFTGFVGTVDDITPEKMAAKERVKRLAQEQIARMDAEAAERRAVFLARASEVLSESLDYERTLSNVAELAVPYFADWCTVTLRENSDNLRIVAIAHTDPVKISEAKRILQRYPPDPAAPHGAPKCIRTGEPEMLTNVTTEILSAFARDQEHLRALQDLRLKSCIAVPLKARHTVFGAISFLRAESGGIFNRWDLQLAEDLARRAGLAVDNARLYRESLESDRRKDEFLATLAHELRNPLAPVRNAMHIIKTYAAPDRALQRARDITERQINHMSRLIDDLLDVSRIRRGKVELRKSPMDLRSAISNAVDSAMPAITAKHHHIEVDLPERPLPVDGDGTRLEQIVVNLLHNAAKYTSEGGRIRVAARIENDEAVLRVADNGMGIAPEMLARIFDPFTQADRSLDRSQGGLGIGLTLVRSLVELHGGRVLAYSAGLGKGSEFVVRLPLTRKELPPAGRAGEEPKTVPSESHRVLVVEDNADSRESLETLLSAWGHTVETAADGNEGVRKGIWFRPDIALVDLGLPGIDGYEVARQMREQLGQNVMLVALTGYGQPEDRRRAKEAGFDLHLVKPANIEELERIVSSRVHH